MKTLFTLSLFFFFLTPSLFAEPPILTASSFENAEFSPENAFDGDFATRWSSLFSDPQWLQIDFGEEKTIVGLTLYWEVAFGSRYRISLSGDGKNWREVYEERAGDGRSDEIYFAPQKARYLKIEGIERGTEWGYSLHEIVLKKESDFPFAKASSGSPEFSFDGSLETTWRVSLDKEQFIQFDFKKPIEISGAELFWKDELAKKYQVALSLDEENWETVYEAKETSAIYADRTQARKDRFQFDSREARFLKIIFSPILDQENEIALSKIVLKRFDDFKSPLEILKDQARSLPDGYFPLWFKDKQLYWTVAGLPKSKKEITLDEGGVLENNFSLIPYMFLDGELISAHQTNLSHQLEKNWMPIPSVVWNHDQFRLEEEVFTFREEGEEASFFSFHIQNTSDKPLDGKFYLTVRPFLVQAPWHYGGLKDISDIAIKDNQLWVNNKTAFSFLQKPDGIRLQTLSQGDLVAELQRGEDLRSEAMSLSDVSRLASGALQYSFQLESASSKSYFFLIPHVDTPSEKLLTLEESRYQELRDKATLEWERLFERVPFERNDSKTHAVLKTNLAYLLINNDPPYIHPGPRLYNESWTRDGAVASAALLRMGFPKMVKEYLEWLVTKQQEDGMVAFRIRGEEIPEFVKEWREYDSQGEFIYAVAEYYRFTKDKKFLEKMFPAVIKALEYLNKIRAERQTKQYEGTPYFGILPESNSHEGYFPAQHSYWDNFWALRGYLDGVFIARELGEQKKYSWIQKEANDFEKVLYRSLEGAMKEKKVPYIPGCVEKGDYDPPAPAIAFFPTQVAEKLPQTALRKTFDQYYGEIFEKRKTGTWEGAHSAYELRIAFAFLMMGEKEKAFEMIDYFFSIMQPEGWHHWGETIFRDIRTPHYLGDMPHGWVSAIYINLIRSLHLYEKEEKLVLAAGIPDAWFKRKEGFRIKEAPTWFGKISMQVQKEADKIRIHMSGEAKPKDGFELHLPESFLPEMTIEKGRAKLREGKVVFKRLPLKLMFKKGS